MKKIIVVVLITSVMTHVFGANNPQIGVIQRQINELTQRIQRLNAQEQGYKLREMLLGRQGANPEQIKNIQEKRDNLKIEILGYWDKVSELEEIIGKIRGH